MTRIAFIGILLASTVPVLAMDGPSLPPTAKKLTKDQFIALLDGKTFSYKSYNHDKLVTGKTKFDFKAMTYSGTYPSNGKAANYGPLPLSISGDTYCYDKTCDGSGAIYLDGTTIYEVNAAGKVGEVLAK